MACKIDKVLVGAKYDRRVKITQEMREQIIREVEAGERRAAIAERHGINIKSIYLIMHPEALEKYRTYNKNNWRRFALEKEARAEAMRNHRAYKRKLVEDNKLVPVE